MRIVDARQELSVRERTRTARAKLNVRLGIENAELNEFLMLLSSNRDRISAVNDDRRIAVFSKP